jgi:hypothetical protein
MYLIEWKSSWEPESSLNKELLADFNQRHKLKRKSGRRVSSSSKDDPISEQVTANSDKNNK